MPDPPEVPPAAERATLLFRTLSARRQRLDGGMQPLTYTEIESYARLTGDEIDGWDVAIIVEMDDAYLGQMAEERAEQMERSKAKRN